MKHSLLFIGILFSLISTGQNLVETGVVFVHKSSVKIILRGRVTDSRTGSPLPGASVYLSDDKVGAVADLNGNYLISGIPAGHHIIEVSHTGYTTLAEHVELRTNLTKDFTLSGVIIENQGVIVTGVAGATSTRRIPVPVSKISRSDLLESSGTNIIDALTRVPGFSQLSTGPAISKPFIRGLGFNRVVIINEGVRQEGQQWGEEHSVEIDELSVGKIEVVKGPASLIYGSDALAGVINFMTNIPVEDGTTKGRIVSNYQSNNGLIALHGSMAGNKNGFNYNLYGSKKSSADYRNQFDGRVLNSRFKEMNYGGYIGLNKSWGYSHLIFSRFDQHAGIVEGDRDLTSGKFLLYAGSMLEKIATENELNSRRVLIPYQRVQHNKIVTDNTIALKRGRLKFNAGYQHNLRTEYGDPENISAKELVFDLKTINYNFQWQMPEKKEWHSTAGVNGMKQFNKNKGEELLIPDYNLLDAGIFFYTQRTVKKTTISGGIRFDNRQITGKEFMEGPDVKFAAFKKSFSNFSGSAGVSFELSEKLNLKFNIARGFRAPSLPELSSNGAHEGSNRYEYGALGLKSETSLQFDGGADLDYEHFHISLAAFVNSMANFIYSSKLLSSAGADSVVLVNGEELQAFKFNQQQALLKGAEVMIDFHPHPLDWLHFENSFSFVQGNFIDRVDGVKYLPLIPASKFISELKADFKKWGNHFRQSYIRTGIEKNFRQSRAFTAFNTETETPGYTLWNAGIGSDISRKEKVLFSLHFSVNNIANISYQNHLSRLKYTDENSLTGRSGVFNTGRNFSLKIQVPFLFH